MGVPDTQKALGRAGGHILQAKTKGADSAGNTDADLSLCGQAAQRPGQLLGQDDTGRAGAGGYSPG